MNVNEALIQLLYKYGSVAPKTYYHSISEQFHAKDGKLLTECAWETKGTLSTENLTEWGGTFGDDRKISTYTLSHCTCACGENKDVTLCYDGSMKDFLDKLLAL